MAFGIAKSHGIPTSLDMLYVDFRGLIICTMILRTIWYIEIAMVLTWILYKLYKQDLLRRSKPVFCRNTLFINHSEKEFGQGGVKMVDWWSCPLHNPAGRCFSGQTHLSPSSKSVCSNLFLTQYDSH